MTALLMAAPELFHAVRSVSGSWILQSLFFLPSEHAAPIVSFGWTLNFEAYFYTVFAVALLFPRRWALAGMGVLFLTLAVFGLVLEPRAPWAAFLTSALPIEFLLGCLVALSLKKFGDRFRVIHLIGLGLGAAV